MANSKPYADAFSSAFEDENAFLDFLRERDDRGEWTKRHTRDLRILPLGTENAPDAEPLPGYTQDDLREILADTMENTRLLHAAAHEIPIFWIQEDYSPRRRSIGKIEYEEILGW